jgi:hypothetical protein
MEVLTFGLLQRHELENHGDDGVDGNNNEQEVDKEPALTSDIRTLLNNKHGFNSSAASLMATNIANRSTRYLGRIGTTAAACIGSR